VAASFSDHTHIEFAGHPDPILQEGREAYAWLARNLRSSKDCERLVQTSESFIEVAMIRLMLKRLAKGV